VVFAGGSFTADTLIARRIAGQAADTVSRMTPRELGEELAACHPRAGQALDSASHTGRMPQTLEDKVIK